MKLDDLREDLKSVLKPSRYRHSIGVADVSCDLAVIYGFDMEKAEVAGLLHDCARNFADEQLLVKCREYKLPVSDIEERCPFLLHGKVGAVIAKEKYRVEEDEIITSIIYHTTGRPAMTLLEKIIFTADYIEPNRKPLPRIEEIRQAAYSDLDLAVTMTLENMLKYLTDSGSEIDTLTIESYEYYKTVIQNRQQ